MPMEGSAGLSLLLSLGIGQALGGPVPLGPTGPRCQARGTEAAHAAISQRALGQELGVTSEQSPVLEAWGLCSPAQEGPAEKDVLCQSQVWLCLSRFSDLLGKQHRRQESLNPFPRIQGAPDCWVIREKADTSQSRPQGSRVSLRLQRTFWKCSAPSQSCPHPAVWDLGALPGPCAEGAGFGGRRAEQGPQEVGSPSRLRLRAGESVGPFPSGRRLVTTGPSSVAKSTLVLFSCVDTLARSH